MLINLFKTYSLTLHIFNIALETSILQLGMGFIIIGPKFGQQHPLFFNEKLVIFTCNSGGKIGSCVGSKGKNSLGSVNAVTTCVKDSHMIKVFLKNFMRFWYCKFRNFRENFIIVNKVKRHVCHAKNLQMVHGLPT